MSETAFSKRLKAAMKRKGVKVKDLAREIPVGKLSVTRWRNGYRHPSPEHQRRLADILGMPMIDLIEPNDPPALAVNIVTEVDDPWQRLTGEERHAVNEVVRLLVRRR